MSADNVLATLCLKDGYRIADIFMIWDGEQDRLYDPMVKESFAQSPHYKTLEEVEIAERRICDEYIQNMQVLEYGCTSYKLDLTWGEYLAAGTPRQARVECPVCKYLAPQLFNLVDGDPALACQPCIDGFRF